MSLIWHDTKNHINIVSRTEEGRVVCCVYLRGQLKVVDCLLPCGSQRSNSGPQAWLQAPLPAELSHQLQVGVLNLEPVDRFKGECPEAADRTLCVCLFLHAYS